MECEKQIKLTEEQIKFINDAISSKQRVEVINTDRGVIIYTVKRKQLNKMT